MKPEIVSKKASVNDGILLLSQYGNAPISEKKINSKLQSGKIIDIREDIEMVESYII